MEQLNMKSAARAFYSDALKYDSSFYDAYKSLAMMSYKEGDKATAAKYLEKELKYNTKAVNSVLLLSDLYQELNQGYLAVPYLQRVAQTDTANAKIKMRLEKLYELYPETKPKVEVKPDSVSKPVTKTVVRRDTSRSVSKTPAMDTVSKTAPQPVKKDTIKKLPVINPVKADTLTKKKRNRAARDSTRKRGFIPIIRNPDSTKIERRTE